MKRHVKHQICPMKKQSSSIAETLECPAHGQRPFCLQIFNLCGGDLSDVLSAAPRRRDNGVTRRAQGMGRAQHRVLSILQDGIGVRDVSRTRMLGQRGAQV